MRPTFAPCYQLLPAVVLQPLVEGAHGRQLQDDGEGVGADADEGHDVRVPQMDEDIELLGS